MDRDTIVNELRSITEEYLKLKNVDLVELIYRYEGKDLFLRVLVDKPQGGISLGECADINREISNILDQRDVLRERYILEVSSPGLDRPLRTKNDFLRCINRQARIFLIEAINGRLEYEGVILQVNDVSVYLGIDDKSIEIPLPKITKAKQIIINI